MRRGEPISLYLKGSGLHYEVTNWPGTLSILVQRMRRGRQNMAGTRIDVWFWFEGHRWHGVQYGPNTDLVHCRRVKS